jgi:Cu2+-exporting ATPase
MAAAVERSSEHPLAAAIVDAAPSPIPEASAVEAASGKGLQGRVEGRLIRIGRPEWVEELGLRLPRDLVSAIETADGRGESAVVVMEEERVIAVIALADRVRDSARSAIESLRRSGIEPVMITGDAEAVARTVAGELGIERYHARVLPADKARLVEQLAAEGPVAFVGDGINDAPALVTADVGIAIGAGTSVAIESADLVLVDDDPADVATAIGLSRRTASKMRQNLAWATGYNVVAIPLAAGVGAPIGLFLDPALGALLMSGSTVVVAVNAMLLRRSAKDGG